MTEREALKEIICKIGVLTYGKERWFKQNGCWYDRMNGDYIQNETLVERICDELEAEIEAEQTEPQFNKDINVRSKTEPYIDIETGILHWCGWKYRRIYEDELNCSEKPNNCEDCIWSVCNYNKAFEDEPQTCEECEHWNDTEDGCADRHGCKDEPQTEEWYTFQDEQEYNARHGKE